MPNLPVYMYMYIFFFTILLCLNTGCWYNMKTHMHNVIVLLLFDTWWSWAAWYRYTSATVIMEKGRSFRLMCHGPSADLQVHPGQSRVLHRARLLGYDRANINAKHHRPPTHPTPPAAHTQAACVKHWWSNYNCDYNSLLVFSSRTSIHISEVSLPSPQVSDRGHTLTAHHCLLTQLVICHEEALGRLFAINWSKIHFPVIRRMRMKNNASEFGALR